MANAVTFDARLAAIIADAYRAGDVVETRQRVVDALQPRLGERLLDLGCGPGYMTYKLARSVGTDGLVEGIDLSQDMLTIAEQACTGLPQAKHRIADIVDLPFEDDSFDGAVAMQALAFVEDLDRALAEIKRVLTPGGRLIVLDTDYDSVVWESADRDRMARVLKAYDDHCPWPDLPRRLPEQFQRSGLRLTRVEAVPMLATELSPNKLIHGVIGLWRNYVVGNDLIDEAEADAWLAEQYERSAAGTFFFCVDRFVFTAIADK